MNEFSVKLPTHMLKLTIGSIHMIMFLTVLDTLEYISCLKIMRLFSEVIPILHNLKLLFVDVYLTLKLHNSQ